MALLATLPLAASVAFLLVVVLEVLDVPETRAAWAAVGVTAFAVTVPFQIGAFTRRLNDAAASAWWLVPLSIPIIGWAVLLLLLIGKGAPADRPSHELIGGGTAYLTTILGVFTGALIMVGTLTLFPW